ncbi:MAG: MlaD family protein, partial [Candidatus Zixiibacteriota bacterium]
MAGKNVEFRVGLLIIAGLIVLGAAIFWIQGYRFGQDYQPVQVVFQEVGSLANGDPVMVSGIRMGKVKKMVLHEDGVMVTLTISKEVDLKQDAVFTVKNIGLMGERFVAVRSGSSDEPLDTTVPARGLCDTGIPEVMGMMGEMTTELRNLVFAIKSSVASDENLDKLSKAIGNFEKLSESLAEYLERNRNNFDKAAENFLAASKGLKTLVSGSTSKIDSTLTRA